MTNLPQLLDFDEQPWNEIAQDYTFAAVQHRTEATRLTHSAQSILATWPDETGKAAAERMLAVAQKLSDNAIGFDDSAKIVTHATSQIASDRDDCQHVVNQGKRLPVQIADDGTVTVNPLVVVGPLPIYRALKSVAAYMTSTLVNLLAHANSEDDASAQALRAARETDHDATDEDGPLDLSDLGIKLQNMINKQRGNKFCVFLSTLEATGELDPKFIRDHMKWNPEKGVYEVILYDPNTGEPVPVEVDPRRLPSVDSDAYGSGKPTYLSIYEEAVRLAFPEYESFNFDNAGRMIRGEPTPEKPATQTPFSEIKQTLNGYPPGAAVAATPNAAEQQPDDIDPSKRLVLGHAYTVGGFTADGKIILLNPWGPDGGMSDGKFYPGEVHLTEEEYRRWVGGVGLIQGR